MESKKVILQTIKRLKEIKSDNALTVPQIMEKMEDKWYFVSEATLRRALLEAQIGQLKAEVNLLDSQIEKKDKLFERVMNALVLKE